MYGSCEQYRLYGSQTCSTFAITSPIFRLSSSSCFFVNSNRTTASVVCVGSGGGGGSTQEVDRRREEESGEANILQFVTRVGCAWNTCIYTFSNADRIHSNMY